MSIELDALSKDIIDLTSSARRSSNHDKSPREVFAGSCQCGGPLKSISGISRKTATRRWNGSPRW
jgi:hypothetical protein